MARYIDADKIDYSVIVVEIDEYAGYRAIAFENDIDAMPTADVAEVKHGWWRKTCVPDVLQCTVCKRPTKMDELCDSEILRAYCPNCGAKMDGKPQKEV